MASETVNDKNGKGVIIIKGNDFSKLQRNAILQPGSLHDCHQVIKCGVDESSRKQILWLHNETCYETLEDGTSTIYQPLASYRVKSLHYGYNKFAALTVGGQILFWVDQNITTSESNAVPPDASSSKPQLLPFKTKDIVCSHGYREDGITIVVTKLALSESKLAAISDDGLIWVLEGLDDPLFNVPYCEAEPKLLHSLQNRRAVEIFAGRDHFCAFILPLKPETSTDIIKDGVKTDRTTIPRISTVFDEHIKENKPFSSEPRFGVVDSLAVAVKSCRLCKAEHELRLSHLMRKVERKRSSSFQEDSLSSPEDETCPFGLRYGGGLRLELSPSSPDVRSTEHSPAHKSVPDKLSVKSATLSAGDSCSLELKPLSRTSAQQSCEQFSLVSMDLIVSEDMAYKLASESSGSTQGEDSFNDFVSCSSSSTSEHSPRTLASEAQTNGVTRRKRKDNLSSQLCVEPFPEYEVWSWGANQFGQLGLGDTIYRRQPALVEHLKGHLVVKIALGESHSAASTAAGEVFVWGSNCYGQIKYSDNNNDKPNKQTYPIRFKKLGPHCPALDIAAGRNITVLIVSQEYHSTVLYCGKNYEISDQELSDSRIVRLPELEKFGHTTNVNCCDDYIIANFVTDSDPQTDRCHHFAIHLLKVVNSWIQIHSLGIKLKFEMWHSKDTVCCALLDSYLSHLWDSILLMVTVSQAALTNISVKQHDMSYFLRQLANKNVVGKLYKLLHQLCNIVAMNGFGTTEFSPNLLSTIDELCLLHEKESCKIHRRITKLFELPLNIVDFLAEKAKGCDPNEHSSLIKLWTNFRNGINCEMDLAEKMRVVWFSNQGNSSLMSLKVPSRRLVREYDKYVKGKQCEIVNITCNLYKVYWNKMIIFSDSFVLIEKSKMRQFSYPLVWVTPVQDANKHILMVTSPEDELVLEFLDGNCKNQMLQDFNTSLFYQMDKNRLVELPTGKRAVPLLPPIKRTGEYTFSTAHKLWPGATYDGTWVNGKMNGSGELIEKDGSRHKGRFKDGNLDGFGIRYLRRDGKHDEHQQGWWKCGKLNGLALIRYSDSSTYEGFMVADQRQGHGVYTLSRESSYIGSWSRGLKSGYGVMSTSRGKYLGMWLDDIEHGKGISFNIDGVLHYGHFEKGIFVNGTCCKPNGIECSGEFNALYMVSGKATLTLSDGVTVAGIIHGDLSTMNELKITNAVCKAKTEQNNTGCRRIYPIETKLVYQDFLGHLPHFEPGIPAGQKWADIFDEILPAASETECSTLWNYMVTKLHQLKNMRTMNNLNQDKCDWDQLECIPMWNSDYSYQYNQMVVKYFGQAMDCCFHPLSRLVVGICDIFSASYSGCDSNSIIVHSAELELQSLIQRVYVTIRRLFPCLPSVAEMESGFHELQDEQGTNVSVFYDVLQEAVITRVYPCLHTLYMVYCKELDEHYTTKLNVLSSKTDLALLNFFDANRQLWPIELKNTNVLDAPVMCATARSKYYESAIDKLQQISSVLSPYEKLDVVVEVFNKISECMKQYSGVWHNWTADEQVPVVLYVIIRAQVSNLGAELFLIRNWSKKYIYGRVDQNITALESCYIHLVKEKEY